MTENDVHEIRCRLGHEYLWRWQWRNPRDTVYGNLALMALSDDPEDDSPLVYVQDGELHVRQDAESLIANAPADLKFLLDEIDRLNEQLALRRQTEADLKEDNADLAMQVESLTASLARRDDELQIAVERLHELDPETYHL